MKKAKIGLIIIIAIFVVVGLPFTLSRVLNIFVEGRLTKSDWIMFSGSYLGGLLGSIAALIALFATYRQAKKYHADDLENRRIAVIPMLNLSLMPILSIHDVNPEFCIECTEAGYSGSKCTAAEYKSRISGRHSFVLSITNSGFGPASNIVFFDGKWQSSFNTFMAGEAKNYILIPPNKHTTVCFEITFNDIMGNKYKQVQTAKFKGEESSLSQVTIPSLMT